MGTRAPLLTFSLAAGILLAGTAFGLRPDAPTHGARADQASGPGGADAAADVALRTEPTSAVPMVAVPVVEREMALPVPQAAPPAAAVADMKHVWQSLNNCGPAAVAMALSTFGVDVSQEVARLALRGQDERRGMGPTPVDPWVKESFGLRSMWRNNGTNDLMRRLLANGFVPMVTQWMQDPTISRVAHWRTMRGYDDARRVFYVNDPVLGNNVALSYDWFAKNWQSFSYRYMVVYRPQDEPLVRAVIGRDWSEPYVRQAMYERARGEALAHDTSFAWLAYGEASYAFGMFAEAVAAFERGLSLGSASG
ncbi:MAG: C39 family peptidase, partial [Chloroflexota bacterium]